MFSSDPETLTRGIEFYIFSTLVLLSSVINKIFLYHLEHATQPPEWQLDKVLYDSRFNKLPRQNDYLKYHLFT